MTTYSNLAVLDERSKAILERHSNIKNLNSWEQLKKNFFSSSGSPLLLLFFIVFVVMFPFLIYLMLPLCFFLLWKTKKTFKREHLSYPLYTPAHSKAKFDPLDIDPETRRPRTPQALLYLGFDPTTQRQAWLTFTVLKQHAWLQATTGGGKTETLFGLYVNFLIYGSGAIMLDGKSDMQTPAKACAIAHRFMRADDIYILNLITGNQSPWGKTKSQLSSTINPYLTGSASSLSELTKALLQDDGDIWSKRAASFVDALTRVLVYSRDKGDFQFNVSHYAEFLQLEALGKLCGRSDIPMNVKQELYVFIKTLAGLDADGLARTFRGESLDPKKSQQPLEQLGFITMQLQPVINMLSGDYGYIFNVVHGSINVRDVILKRRILLCLIPALEKAAPSLRSLGEIILALIRDLLASGIGNQTEGNLDLAIKRRFTNDITPYMNSFDEPAAYFVENAFAPIYAQSRSLGIMNILGSQDNYALEKASKNADKELGTVFANSNTKIIGKIEDTGDSMKQIIERVSEANFYEVKQMSRNTNSMFSNSYYQNDVAIERKKFLEPEHFLTLKEGEAYVIHQDRQVRVDMFAVFLPNLKNRKANVLIPPCELPPERQQILIDDFKKAKGHLILRSRGLGLPTEDNDNLAPESEIVFFNEKLKEEPSFSGAFYALKKFQVESNRLVEEALNNFKNSEHLLIANKNRPREQTANINTEPHTPADSESIRSKAMEDYQEMRLALDAIFGQSKEEMESSFANLNAEEAYRQGNKKGIETAKMNAIKTVQQIDEALTDYPMPPPAEVDRGKLLETLRKFKALTDE